MKKTIASLCPLSVDVAVIKSCYGAFAKALLEHRHQLVHTSMSLLTISLSAYYTSWLKGICSFIFNNIGQHKIALSSALFVINVVLCISVTECHQQRSSRYCGTSTFPCSPSCVETCIHGQLSSGLTLP